MIAVLISIYYVPIFVDLLIYSVRIRLYVRKHQIHSLDETYPKTTYAVGKLSSFQLLGEVIIYAIAAFCGIFTFLALPKNFISKPILPDA